MLQNSYLKKVYQDTVARNSDQTEFLQAVLEVFESLEPYVEKHPELQENAIMERLVEPERMLTFRVTWEDDNGKIHVNRGYRCQFNSAIGPYKGGLRFHPSVDASIIKFLGFEQIFKNSLTGLPLGGAKGGSNFDPKGKSDGEVMRFCQSFMTELQRHIGSNCDVPAGDIGVGGREIGYLFGQYKRLCKRPSVLHGGDAPLPAEGHRGRQDHRGLRLRQRGHLRCGEGHPAGRQGHRHVRLPGLHSGRGRHQAGRYQANQRGGAWPHPGVRQAGPRQPLCGWLPRHLEHPLPDRPALPKAVTYFQDNHILFAPAKAANAGGVATSGLEMSQNSMRSSWEFDEVDDKLRHIMVNIFHQADAAAKECGHPGDLVMGANVAGFMKVSSAMLSEGLF